MTTFLRLAEFLAACYFIARLLRPLWRLRSTRRWLPFVLFCVIPSTADAAGNEARCDELGANCICSNPMNSPSGNYTSGASYIGDSAVTTKHCAVDGVAGTFLTSDTNFADLYEVATSGESFTALPAGHSVSNVLRTHTNGGGGFAGHNFAGGTATARRAMRFYKYYSSNYGWVGGACLNGNKIAQLMKNAGAGGGPIFTETAGQWSFYAVEAAEGWSPSGNGCCDGPGPGEGSTLADPLGSPSTFRGKWFRYEVILHNATTSGHSWFEVYIKNVTDNTPEIKIIDASVAKNFGSGINWTSTLATTLSQTSDHPDFLIDMFRNGTCAGFAGFSHYLAAAWSSDDGQRIGAATEIEGAEAPPDTTIVLIFEWAPVVASAIWHFRQAIVFGMLVCWMMGGAIFSLTSQKTKQLTKATAVHTLHGISYTAQKAKTWLN